MGEGPGHYEDLQGRPFVGKSGKLLDKMLRAAGLNRTSVSVLNIVKCRPPENRDPLHNEQKICGTNWLKHQILYLKMYIPFL